MKSFEDDLFPKLVFRLQDIHVELLIWGINNIIRGEYSDYCSDWNSMTVGIFCLPSCGDTEGIFGSLKDSFIGTL